MNYELLKRKMDKFFKETSAKDLVGRYESLGYRFVETKFIYNNHSINLPITHINYLGDIEQKKSVHWYSLHRKQPVNLLLNKSLEKFEVFLFKLHYETSRKSIFQL